ncbi:MULTISPECIES: helix-turn-helix domain-containing protein [Catenuloplanes]|uniref:Transcriptional regulator with XRE-family HTH domain n=1 Tax=Catenuloplanes niger TaxID=587534 RepID=A0AAE4A088_9ACTN|nr:helix-turn-helix transcriptional regulator [Catenuloplanes niger]MDR7328071.1 transcriptional regulator with XRE-family HTH domain [Catenuloplanes niger]
MNDSGPEGGEVTAERPLPSRDESVGAVLARLRRDRGLSGASLAAMVGMSQPKISRLERGVGSPNPRDIETVARALGADEHLARDLARRTMVAQSQIADWRPAPDDLRGRQEIVADWDSSSGTVRDFAVTILPGILQTSQYAHAVLAAFDTLIHGPGGTSDERTILSAVTARLSRQEALTDPGKRFHMVIVENALRGPMCTPTEMLGQLAHLRDVAAFPTVTIEIIPEEAVVPVPFVHGFTMYDDQLLVIDIYHTGLASRGERDIGFYRRVFDAMAEHATDDIAPILDRHTRRLLAQIQRDLG